MLLLFLHISQLLQNFSLNNIHVQNFLMQNSLSQGLLHHPFDNIILQEYTFPNVCNYRPMNQSFHFPIVSLLLRMVLLLQTCSVHLISNPSQTTRNHLLFYFQSSHHKLPNIFRTFHQNNNRILSIF